MSILLEMLKALLAMAWLSAWLAAVGSALAAEPLDPVAAGELPRYVFFDRNPFSPDPLHWRQWEPERFTVASMREFAEKIGTAGNARLRIGATFPFSLLENDVDVLKRSIRAMLDAAREADVPVLIMLDGQNWWQSRPDLWNWWDPNLPGFNPDNRYNVEWTGWGAENAIKISWRNWGQQVRIRPAQNIFAPRVQKEVNARLQACAGVVAQWYRELPKDKRYLLGGVKVGWEASINVNAYYYPDGNRLFEQNPADASRDPTQRDIEKGFTFGTPCLGYAAATAAGLVHPPTRPAGSRSHIESVGGAGRELTVQDHEFLVQKYLAGLSRIVRRQGIPPHLIFTHQGGTYAPWDKHLSFKPAINDDSIPGWSFYSHDPQDSGSLGKDLEAAGRQQWAAAEWWRGGANEAEWRQHFERTLSFKQCRLIAVYNWEPFMADAAALAAVKSLVDEEKKW
jgi:hypothetical protein